MKRLLIGFVLIGAFLLSATVSFASDGPPTAKDGYDIVSDISNDYTAEAVFYFTNVDAPVVSSDANLELNKNAKDKNFGLASSFYWEALGTVPWPLYNEWLIHKEDLAFKAYAQPAIGSSVTFTRCNC